MTPLQANDFIKKYPGALNFVKRSHLEELSPLFECHVEAIEVRKDEFHDLQKGQFTPRKETLDKFAQAAGVSFNATADTTRMEGDGCYVGTAQGMTMGPDGKWILGPICEYEFDVDVRLEEMKLNEKDDWDHKIGNRPGKRPYTEKELAQERVQLRKVGRQRANTGARSRATLAVLGMQTGFKDLFTKDSPPTSTKVFLFSRVIVNAKNEMVLNRMLENIAGPVGQLYGNNPATAQIAAPAQATPYVPGTDAGDPPMRHAEDTETTPASLAAEAYEPDDGFSDSPPAQDDPRRVSAVLILEQFLTSDRLTAANKEYIQWLIDHPESEKASVDQLEVYVRKCQSVMQKAAS